MVNDVSFRARRGEVIGYLGPNGSGKSTTLKMIAGLVEPSDGEILFDGKAVERDWVAHRQQFGYVPEEQHSVSASDRGRVSRNGRAAARILRASLGR